MIRAALVVLTLTVSLPAAQAAFFWEGLSPYMEKSYCLKHYSAERCAIVGQVKAQAQNVRTTQPNRPAAPPPKRPVAQK